MYTHRKGGEEISYGLSTVSALLGILGLQGIGTGRVPGRDGGFAEGFPDLIGKRIGLLLQRRLYTKGDGTEGSGMQIILPFHPDTRQTARELIERVPARTIEHRAASLSDKDERRVAPVVAPPGTTSHVSPTASPAGGDFDDDIPF